MAEKKLHVKPSKEELKANALKAAEEFEKIDETPKETPEPTPPTEEPKEEQKEEVKEEVVEEAPKEETPPEVKEEEEKEVVDYKKKYVDSSRGAQALLEKDKQMNDAIDKASQLPPPTDEEMTVIYPDWDVMSDSEKRVAIKTELADRKFELLHKASVANKSITEWHGAVDKFIENPKTMINYPELEGKQEEFRIYAAKPTYKNADFHLIVKSFLFDNEKVKASKPKNEGSMFPKGTAGPTVKDNPTNTISLQELTNIRNSNYKLYKEKLALIKKGTLQMEAIE